MSSIIEKVDSFIQRLHDMDCIISSEARQIFYILPKEPEGKSLADFLANAIHDYEKYSEDKELKFSRATICLLWINRAFTHGIVKDGEGLIRKLKECREKNIQLEKDLERLSEDYLRTQEEHGFVARIFEPKDRDSSEG